MLTHLFTLLNKVYRRLALYAYRKKDIAALMEAPIDVLPEQVTHQQGRLPPDLGCSFRVEITAHSRNWLTRPERLDLPEWALDNKLRAYDFMQALGVRTPKVFWRGRSLDDIDILPNSIVKPEDASLSQGVFLIDAERKALEVKTGKIWNADSDMRAHMRHLLSTKAVGKDVWYSEEAVLGRDGYPAPDVKFYCFYGECVLVRVDSYALGKDRQSRCLDRNLQISDIKAFPSDGPAETGVEERHVLLAEKISLSIPSPFMRIDFLFGDDLVFGEIGNLVGRFANLNSRWDRRLGRAFIDARGRLYDDLRNGKRFETFDGLYRHHRPQKPTVSDH